MPGLVGLHVVDGVGDLEADAEHDAHGDAVLLREVQNHLAVIVRDNRLVEQLVGDVLTDADHEVRPVRAEQHGLGGIPRAVVNLVETETVQGGRRSGGERGHVDRGRWCCAGR